MWYWFMLCLVMKLGHEILKFKFYNFYKLHIYFCSIFFSKIKSLGDLIVFNFAKFRWQTDKLMKDNLRYSSWTASSLGKKYRPPGHHWVKCGGLSKGPFRKHYEGGVPSFAICQMGGGGWCPDIANLMEGRAPRFCKTLIIQNTKMA